jgi:hypothetical protein
MFKRRSPFVTQSELVTRLKQDRSDIERELRIHEDLTRRPRRGVTPVPHQVTADWQDLAMWLEDAIRQLEQPRAIGDLQQIIKAWQARREKVVAERWLWKRRGDVIAVGPDE